MGWLGSPAALKLCCLFPHTASWALSQAQPDGWIQPGFACAWSTGTRGYCAAQAPGDSVREREGLVGGPLGRCSCHCGPGRTESLRLARRATRVPTSHAPSGALCSGRPEPSPAIPALGSCCAVSAVAQARWPTPAPPHVPLQRKAGAAAGAEGVPAGRPWGRRASGLGPVPPVEVPLEGS